MLGSRTLRLVRGGWSKIWASAFARAVAVLAGGTAMAQVFTLLAAPLLTRLYAPEQTGEYGLYLSFVGFVSGVLALLYDTAIVAAPTDRDASYLAVGAMLLVVPSSLLASSGLLVLAKRSILGFGGLPTVSLMLTIPALFLIGCYGVLRYWLIRVHDFKLVSQVAMTQGGVRSVVQVGLGSISPAGSGLVLGDVLGRALGLGRMARSSWSAIKTHLGSFSWGALWGALRRNKKFPIYSLPSTLIDSLAASLPLPFIAQLYGVEAAGYYALVQRVIAAPLGLIGSSVADVFHSKIADLARTNRSAGVKLFLRTAGGLLTVGILPTITLAILGDKLFGFVFGAKWVMAGHMARLMAPWALAQLVVSPVSRVAFVYDGQEVKLAYDLVALATVFVSMYLGFFRGLSMLNTLLTLSVLSCLAYALYFLLLFRLVWKNR